MCMLKIKGRDVEFQEETSISNLLQQKTSNEHLLLGKVVEYINDTPNTVYFIDEKLHSDMNEQKNSIYMWLYTGHRDQNDRPIFISLLKKQGGLYSGWYVGTPESLAKNAAVYFNINENSAREQVKKFYDKFEKKTQVVSDVSQSNEESKESAPMEFDRIVTTIYDRLAQNPWNTLAGLDRYLKILGCRAGQLLEEKNDRFFIKNASKALILNIGLQDIFGNDILVLYKWHEKNQSYFAEQIMDSKSDIVAARFSKEDALRDIAPISFFDSVEVRLPEDLSMDDIEISFDALNHIINERRFRLPEDIQSLSEMELANMLKKSITHGLESFKNDPSTIKPNYSAKKKSISWLIPANLHDETTDPEIYILFTKGEYFYSVRTILEADEDLNDRIVSMSIGLNQK